MNIFKRISENLLFIITLFLLAFIPLYPKIPLIDIKNTWVYIRAEDFVVLSALLIWFIYFLKRKVTLKTPLTIPILIFWIIGAIATIHGVLIIFPTLANIFPNVAFLSYLRHIEYMSLFFVAYSSIKDRKQLIFIIWTLIATFVVVTLYGIGQRYLGLPAYLTMNEEFAKGIPITLSRLSRVPSTFAGHYDLAAYLVMIIPILLSLVFGFRNLFMKFFLVLVSILGVIVLFMTVSRVSFAVLFVALFALLYFHKKKLALLTIPLVFVLGLAFISMQSNLFERFGNTVQEVDVLVDANTGKDIGHVQFVPFNSLEGKTILIESITDKSEIEEDILIKTQIEKGLSFSNYKSLFKRPPETIPFINANMTSNGEILPQGTSYINLSLSPVKARFSNFFYETKRNEATTAASVHVVSGDFLVKRAEAYDLSFTTRFQGEWPNTIKAFERNLFFGSGYGSVSLAVDNNYLRILGEIGALGFIAYGAVFLALFVYIRKTLPLIDSRLVKSFVYGSGAGLIGLAFNAVLIDVFEASKIAFQMWMLIGLIVGILTTYHLKGIDMKREALNSLSSSYAIIIYLVIGSLLIFLPILNNYFIGDDFTWFRWAADCRSLVSDPSVCGSNISQITHYFLKSDGFFYRPGTKTYFLLMYNTFWLNPVVYHTVSIILHTIFVILFFALAQKILKTKSLAAVSTLIFLITSGYMEIALWISATGHLFNAVFIILSLLLYILWEERKNPIYFLLSFISIFLGLLFYELGIVAPFLIIAYQVSKLDSFKLNSFVALAKDYLNYIIFVPILAYLLIRFSSGSHWFNGDYSYDILKLPFNFAGNLVGYINLIVFGPMSLSLYNAVRALLRDQILLVLPIAFVLIFLSYYIFKNLYKVFDLPERRTIFFSILFSIISLSPFLGLGNISPRYSYLASFGIILILALLLKQLYKYLLFNGKTIAMLSIMMLFSVFTLLHTIQGQQQLIDWNSAGKKVERFLISIDEHYNGLWSQQEVNLNITKVPIKNGDAWVFPVGLNDAVWFAFKNNNIRVNIYPDSETAYQDINPNIPTWVLEFQDDGRLNRVVKGKNGELMYAK